MLLKVIADIVLKYIDTIRTYKYEKLNPQKFFAITTLFFGLLFIVITPPFQAPDEIVHFYRAYQISNFNILEDRRGETVGGVLPDSVTDTVLITSTNPSLSFLPANKYDIGKTKQALVLNENPQPDRFYDFAGAALYPPIVYAPQAFAIGVTKSLGLPPIIMMYAARAASLVTWVVLLIIAIKLIPFRKWALVFVGLLPMVVFQASSVSADPVSMGLFIVFLVYLLALYHRKAPITVAQKAKIIAIAVAITVCKQIMFVLLPLVLLLRNSQFKNKRAAIVFKTVVLILPVVALGAWMFVTKDASVEASYRNGQDPAHQINFSVLNPHSFINVLFNTYFFTWGDAVALSFIGSFGWMDTPLALPLVVFGYIGLFFMLAATYAKETVVSLGKLQRLLLLAIAILYWLAASAALYAYYTPPEFKIIIGLQGRYFLPLAVLAIPILCTKFVKTEKRFYVLFGIVTPVLLLVASVITLFFRYYINNV